MDTKYKVLEHDMCCGKCQFAIDQHYFINGYTSLSCGHKANVNKRGMMEVEENGLCNMYAKPYDISEEQFLEQLAEEAKRLL